MIPDGNFEIDDDLAGRLEALFGELLETEREAIVGKDDARRAELWRLIEKRESVLKDDAKQYALFNEHIASLPESERPVGPIQKSFMIAKYVGDLKSKLDNWRRELAELERRPVNKQAIFNSARSKAMHLLRQVAVNESILNTEVPPPPPPPGDENWNLSELDNTISKEGWKRFAGLKPSALRFPNDVGNGKPVNSWKEMYKSVVERLFDKKLLLPNDIPWKLEKYFRPEKQWDPKGFWKTVELKNGLFLYTHLGMGGIVSRSCCFIQVCREDPAYFQVQLR